MFGVRIESEKTGIRSCQQTSVRSAPQRSHKIRVRIVGNTFGAHSLRVIAADTFVGGEPDNFLRIDEDAKDMIRAERAAGAFKGEMLDRFPAGNMKGAASVGSNPNIIARTACDRGHCTRGRVCLRRLKRVVIINEPALVSARASARPKTSMRIYFQRVDEVIARFAAYFFCLAVGDPNQAAALSPDVESFTNQRETRDLQRSGMILIHA